VPSPGRVPRRTPEVAVAPRERQASAARLIAGSFLAAILTGALLLALPVSHAHGVRVAPLDALFTATSAVCVTGLVVVDTGTAFSRFGQTVIMVLFQLGGLGLLTLGTILTLATGRRLGYGARIRVRAQVSAADLGSVLDLVRSIVVLVAAVEAVGALLLYVRFAGIAGVGTGIFFAVFHSISAFNNAGFALWPDSLSRFVTDPLVSLTIAGLIIVGGLGFVVIVNLIARFGPARRARVTLHTRMALAITLFLVCAGAVVILLLEWGNPETLGRLDVPGRLLASFFQAVTPRTAGFNTLNYELMNTSTVLFTILLMFIGGNPGSTAGGIKTLTFYVLAISAWSVVRQREDYIIFGRRIAPNTVVRAGVIAFSGVMLCGAAVTLLAISEPDIGLLPLLFETISAFGTVGLSLGVTGDLSPVGRVVIILLMYLGRIGFMTFALALVVEHPAREIRYPAEDVVIG
jgi:trk system potassium uptake protein TrkH